MKLFLATLTLFIFNMAFSAEPICRSSNAAAIDTLKKCKQVLFSLAGSAGGGSDKMIRDVSSEMAQFGSVSVVENLPAANGHTATQTMVANEDPCRFLVTSNSNISLNTLNPNLKPRVDLAKSFAAVSLMSTAPFVLAVNNKYKGMEIKDLKSLNESQKLYGLDFASSGVGSISHLLSANLEAEVLTNGHSENLDLTADSAKKFDVHIPYVGSSAASLGLLRGEVAYLFESPTTIAKTFQTKQKDIVIIGHTGEKPLNVLGLKEPIQPLKSIDMKLRNMVALPYNRNFSD